MSEALEQEQEVVERQLSDDEIKAMDHGWVPKEQWKGDPEEWVPARVFNIRGELFGRIAKDKAKIGELQQTVDALVDHNRKIEEIAYKRALDNLKRDKRAALEEGDVEAVMEIDEKLEQVREQHVTAKQEFEQKVTPKGAPVNPVFEEWHANNQWYLTDGTRTQFANEVFMEMVQAAQNSGKQLDPAKAYQEVARKVRAKFPERFETRTRTSARADAVESSGDAATNKPDAGDSSSPLKETDLTDDERRIMNNILKTSKMTKKEYLSQMAEYAKRKGR